MFRKKIARRFIYIAVFALARFLAKQLVRVI